MAVNRVSYTKAKQRYSIGWLCDDGSTLAKNAKIMQKHNTDGLILAGGQSRRMGHDKALLQLGGCSLLAHHIAAMTGLVDKLWVSGDYQAHVPASVHCLVDKEPGQGPLAGLLAVLEKTTAGRLWLVSCDSFGVSPLLYRQLLQALEGHSAQLAYVCRDDRPQPLLALLNTAVAADLQSFWHRGERSVLRWYQQLDTVAVKACKVPGLQCNINTPADYQRLLDGIDSC